MKYDLSDEIKQEFFQAGTMLILYSNKPYCFKLTKFGPKINDYTKHWNKINRILMFVINFEVERESWSLLPNW